MAPCGPSGIWKVKCSVFPITDSEVCAGLPVGTVVVLSTCAAVRVWMASMSALSPWNWERMTAESKSEYGAGREGS